MSTIPSLPSRSQRLHHLIHPLHEGLLTSAVIAAILAEAIRLRTYITLLHALRGMHATMDARLPELPLRLPIAPLHRRPALDADLRIWDPTSVMRAPEPEPLIAALDSHGLIGALYALEDFRHATPDLAAHLARTFALPDANAAGLSYHGRADARHWRHCKDAIDRLTLTPQHEETIERGALTVMDLLLARHQSIEPHEACGSDQGRK